MKSRSVRTAVFFVSAALVLQGFAALVSGCGRRTEQPLPAVQADLVVCTDLEPAVYEPVVKEFEERTGLTVEVQAGTSEEVRGWIRAEADRKKQGWKPWGGSAGRMGSGLWREHGTSG